MAAAALAAMMSTFDSYLLCWSSILINDIVLPLRPGLNDRQKIKLTRFAVVGCGLFVLGWGYLYSPPETFFRFMAITGTMYSASVLLTTAAGLYWKKANTPGTLASLVVAGALPLTTIFLDGAHILPVEYEWMVQDKVVGIATFVASFACIVIVSLLTQSSHPPKALVRRGESS
jgi:Na+/proline symporter